MLRRCITCLLVLLPAVVPAAELSTAKRIELLERRASQVTHMTLQLEELRNENRQLRGEIENLGYKLEQLERKQRDMYLDVDQRIGALQSGAAAGMPFGEGGVMGDTSDPSSGSAAGDGTQAGRSQIDAEYQAAYALLNPRTKRYGEAAKAFSAFIKKYPNDALTPNAHYWLGEAYYVTQKNADARKAFEAVVNQYPASAKVPDALYKIGRLQEVVGKRSAARESYQQVVERYADSVVAELARQRLDKLKK